MITLSCAQIHMQSATVASWNRGLCLAQVAKSPTVPVAAAAFQITAAGMEAAAQDVDHVAAVGQGIRDDMKYVPA